jgi:hypothetical protein
MKLFTKDNLGASFIKRGFVDRNVCALCLIKTKDVFRFTNIIPIIFITLSHEIITNLPGIFVIRFNDVLTDCHDHPYRIMLGLEVSGQVAVKPELLVADLALVGPVVNVANPFFLCS